MKIQTLLRAAGAFALLAAGCGDDNSTQDSGGTTDLTMVTPQPDMTTLPDLTPPADLTPIPPDMTVVYRPTILLEEVATVIAVLLICWNGLLTELMRERKIKSSSSGAFPASVWVSWAKGPAWLERLFDRVGYPFTQPASAVFCAAYRVSPRVFEGILGNYILDRDIAFRSVVVNRTISPSDPWTTYVVEGAPPPGTTPKGAAVPVGPRLRVLVPLRVAERLRFFLRGEALGPPGALTVRWNGQAVPLKPIDSAQRSGAPSPENAAAAEVPAELSHGHARVNELVIDGLPPGARLRQIDFESLGTWWR